MKKKVVKKVKKGIIDLELAKQIKEMFEALEQYGLEQVLFQVDSKEKEDELQLPN